MDLLVTGMFSMIDALALYHFVGMRSQQWVVVNRRRRSNETLRIAKCSIAASARKILWAACSAKTLSSGVEEHTAKLQALVSIDVRRSLDKLTILELVAVPVINIFSSLRIFAHSHSIIYNVPLKPLSGEHCPLCR